MKPRIVLATTNPAKLRELEDLLAPWQVEVLAQSRFTRDSVAETGLTFVENAILKARYAAEKSGLPAVADDSGIEVDALRGRPGIYSARYAGQGASDTDNLQRLLVELAGVPLEKRTARYRCALVYMRYELDPAPIICQASWEGTIMVESRGDGGFGYDPIFQVAGLGVTAAELSAEAKNQLSHRGKALRFLVAELEATGVLPRRA
ncbi:MAG: RdgB/HAM1 family non-canonical purine NTP pyrophosphatase [Steroidobacteraceae bacterium]